MKKTQVVQSLLSVIRSQSQLILGLVTVAMAGWLHAEPFVDDLENLSHVSNDSGNCEFSQDDEGRLVVTKNDDPANQFPASFGWNIQKASREEGFSLDPADEQFILEIKGIVPVTNGKPQAKLFVVPFFGTATQSLGPLKGGDRNFFIPVEPDENGDWRVDIREVVNNYFDEDNRPTWWFPEVIIESAGETETGYGFASFAAVGDSTQTGSPAKP